MSERKIPLNPKLFRDKATILGCPNAKELSDLDVWNYILRAQGKPEIVV